MAQNQVPGSPLEVVAIPMDLAWQDPAENVARMRAALAALPSSSMPRLCVFPELTLTGFTTVNPAAFALKESEPVLQTVRDLAREFNTSLVFGYPELLPTGQVKNALSYVGRDGAEWARYHKMHLFTQGASPETATYTAGDHPVIVEDEGWKIGLSICFDLRFPELFRKYAQEGCHLILLSACWVGGPTKSTQFRALSAGQAVISQSFVVALNRTGKDPFCQFEGEALIHGPRGEALESKVGERAIATLDPALLKGARNLDVLSSLRDRY